MRIKFIHAYDDIISLENLLEAWKEFVKGKRSRKDVQKFEQNLMGNIISLHNDLAAKIYKHGPYQAFNINDPKPRQIHKAPVRDRLLHHAIHRVLYPFFDRVFVPDAYSCRLNKGTHRAINRFRDFAYKVSKNNTQTCWVLKCDIRKFFENIDHEILLQILAKYISDQDILWLLSQVITSFSSRSGAGLPLGNLTSQLFVNIYMNEFDQFVKHKLRAKPYIRYADDFVILSENKKQLTGLKRAMNPSPLQAAGYQGGPRYEMCRLRRLNLIASFILAASCEVLRTCVINRFLMTRLKLSLHPDKVFIKTIYSGVDFLGWVNFSDHGVLRTTTKRRMLNKLGTSTTAKNLNSYLGSLEHGNTQRLQNLIKK